MQIMFREEKHEGEILTKEAENKGLLRKIRGTHAEEENKRSKGRKKDADCADGK